MSMEEKILKAIEGLNQSFAELKTDVNQKIDSLSDKVDLLDNKVGSLSDKVDLIGNRVDSLSDKVDLLNNKVNSISDKVDLLENQVHENTQILKALEHLAQFNKAEHDRMSFNLAEIGAEVKSIDGEVSPYEKIYQLSN